MPAALSDRLKSVLDGPVFVVLGTRRQRGFGEGVQRGEIGGEGHACQATATLVVGERGLNAPIQPDEVRDAAGQGHAERTGGEVRGDGASGFTMQEGREGCDESSVAEAVGGVDAAEGLVED